MRKAFRYILIFVLIQLNVEATAQFKKPLSGSKKQSDEAMFNLGIIAGPSITHWHHFDVAEAGKWYLKDYTPKLQLAYTGGLYFEAILNKHFSVGINVLYTQHNVSLQYVNEQFPHSWNNGILYSKRTYDITANYQSVSATVPLTYYFLNVKDPIRPYLYIAPRFSYILNIPNILNGKLTQNVKDYLQNSPAQTVIDTTDQITPNNHVNFNVGATIGAGVQFRLSTSYYYFLIKTEAFANWNFLNTFTKKQLENEFNNKRFDADAAATITFIFPLKKSLKDACYITH